ncbi:MAG: hypothetical protein M3Z31_03545 [Pseudomonadota bacterium]|nr:hypothetical protein [Pseudomonadota bacterium]
MSTTDAHVRSLAATCRTCHAAALPPLDGANAAAIQRAMQEFRSGARAGTVMPQLARGYTDAESAAIAEWLARRRG